MILRSREINEQAGRMVVDVPVEDMWSESCPEFPLRGTKITTDEGGRRLTGYDLQKAGYTAVEPDGRFRVVWPGQGFSGADIVCDYDIELELGTRPAPVMEKVDERAAAYSRMLDLHRESANGRRQRASKDAVPDWVFLGFPAGFVPALFVFRTDAVARNMRDVVASAYDAGDERLSSLVRLRARPELPLQLIEDEHGEQYEVGGVLAGRYFLFAGLDALESDDPFGRAFYSIEEYPMHLRDGKGDGSRVSLEDAARERAEADARRLREHKPRGLS
jgi:hypothetical protein